MTSTTHSSSPMSFTGAIRSVLGQYANFTGRASRREFWFFTLFTAVVQFVLGVGLVALMFASAGPRMMNDAFEPGMMNDVVEPTMMVNSGAFVAFVVYATLVLLWSLYLVIPTIAVHVRRFHDAGYTGWLLLISLVPYVGSIVVFVFMVLPSVATDNQWGPAPAAAPAPTAAA